MRYMRMVVHNVTKTNCAWCSCSTMRKRKFEIHKKLFLCSMVQDRICNAFCASAEENSFNDLCDFYVTYVFRLLLIFNNIILHFLFSTIRFFFNKMHQDLYGEHTLGEVSNYIQRTATTMTKPVWCMWNIGHKDMFMLLVYALPIFKYTNTQYVA